MCVFLLAQSDEGQSVCMCVKEAGGVSWVGAAKCTVTGGVSEREKESLVVSGERAQWLKAEALLL